VESIERMNTVGVDIGKKEYRAALKDDRGPK
jgi:hypothetical protein